MSMGFVFWSLVVRCMSRRRWRDRYCDTRGGFTLRLSGLFLDNCALSFVWLKTACVWTQFSRCSFLLRIKVSRCNCIFAGVVFMMSRFPVMVGNILVVFLAVACWRALCRYCSAGIDSSLLRSDVTALTERSFQLVRMADDSGALVCSRQGFSFCICLP